MSLTIFLKNFYVTKQISKHSDTLLHGEVARKCYTKILCVQGNGLYFPMKEVALGLGLGGDVWFDAVMDNWCCDTL